MQERFPVCFQSDNRSRRSFWIRTERSKLQWTIID